MYRLFQLRILRALGCFGLMLSVCSVPAAFAEPLGNTLAPVTYEVSGDQSSVPAIRAQLKARQYTTLSAGVSGHLVSFDVSIGKPVKRGEVIARFDCRMETQERNIARAKLDAAKEKIRVNERLSELNNVAELELQLSRAERAIAQAELKRIEAQLDYCVVDAPFDGVVVEKHVQAHQFVNRGEPLLELVNLEQLEIEMIVPSVWLGKIGGASDFQFSVDETGVVVQALLDRTGGVVEPVSQTVKLIGVMKPGQSRTHLLPGMSGSVRFIEP